MRRVVSVLLGIGCCLFSYGPANAEMQQEPEWSHYRSELLVYPNELLRACCPIYCPKPQPYIPCFSSGCGVGYCPKPLPCVGCFATGCSANCYCPKPCPNLCRPIAADDYHCAKARPDCSVSRACETNPTLAPAESYANQSHMQGD
jgi:hypothetical protein